MYTTKKFLTVSSNSAHVWKNIPSIKLFWVLFDWLVVFRVLVFFFILFYFLLFVLAWGPTSVVLSDCIFNNPKRWVTVILPLVPDREWESPFLSLYCYKVSLF